MKAESGVLERVPSERQLEATGGSRSVGTVTKTVVRVWLASTVQLTGITPICCSMVEIPAFKFGLWVPQYVWVRKLYAHGLFHLKPCCRVSPFLVYFLVLTSGPFFLIHVFKFLRSLPFLPPHGLFLFLSSSQFFCFILLFLSFLLFSQLFMLVTWGMSMLRPRMDLSGISSCATTRKHLELNSRLWHCSCM